MTKLKIMPHAVGTFLKGVGVENVELDANNHLIVHLDNGETVDAGEFKVDDEVTSGSKKPVAGGTLYQALARKVDKVDGKGLSTNDYSNEEKAQVDRVRNGSVVVENTLSEVTSGSQNPVSGDAVHNIVTPLSDAVTRDYPFIKGGFIALDSGVGTVANIEVTSHASFAYMVLPVQAGSKYVLRGKGGGPGRLWGWLDADNVIISVSNGYASTSDGELILTAPADAKTLIVNTYTDHSGYSLRGVANPWPQINKIDDTISSVKGVLGPLHGKVSLIGDSISTYKGYIYDDGKTYYPNGNILAVEDTYWMKLITSSNAELEVNASYSGSCVANTRPAPYPSLCDRIPLIGNPDTVVIALGTNDSADNVDLGTFDYDVDVNDLDESKFRNAYIKGIKMIQSSHPDATIICVALRMRDGYRESIKSIAKFYGLLYVEAQTYDSDDSKHPSTPYAMSQIASAINLSWANHNTPIQTAYRTFTEEYLNTDDEDNIRNTGVYKRTGTSVILWVYAGTDGTLVQMKSYASSTFPHFRLLTRRLSEGGWSDWVDMIHTIPAMIPMTTSGKIEVHNDKIVFPWSYLYIQPNRMGYSGTVSLTITDPVTALQYDAESNVISQMSVSHIAHSQQVDGIKKFWVGVVIRDASGNVVDLHLNTTSKSIVYMNGSEPTYDYNPSAIKYIPHRGVCDAEIPENTTYSVMWAAIYGLMYSECDVRYTSDGVGVVMHDETINRTMVNANGTAISGNVTVANSTLATLQTYKYKTTNQAYASTICTMREYIDACAQWNVCPIIQGSMSDDDLAYCMQKLGDNWICYGGNFAKVRTYSDKVLCLTSATYNTTEAMITALKAIGGRVGYSQLSNETLTDDIITACRTNRFEVMASYAYDVANIPDAIRRGCTIVLANNVGKAATALLATSLGGWDAFTHTGAVSNGALSLESGQHINYKVDKKGSYRIHIEFDGSGTITLPTYAWDASYRPTTFTLANGVFDMTFLKVDTSAYVISVDTTNSLKIKNITICYE